MKYLLLALLVLGFQRVALAEFKCLDDINQLSKAIAQSKDCSTAGNYAHACADESDSDLITAGAAKKVCEKDFLSKLSKKEKSDYSNAIKKCNDPENQQNWAQAFCELTVASNFSMRYTSVLDCSADLDSLSAKIAKSKSCEDAINIAETCAYGSSADVSMTSAAKKVCENDFLSKMSKSEKNSYMERVRKCENKKYETDGTMAISFRAFCALNVASHFSTEFKALENNSCSRAPEMPEDPAASYAP